MSYRKYKWKLALHKNYESAFVTQLSRALNTPTRICTFFFVHIVVGSAEGAHIRLGGFHCFLGCLVFYSVETKSVNTVVYLLCRVSLSSRLRQRHMHDACKFITSVLCASKMKNLLKIKKSEDGQKKKDWNWKYAFVFPRIYSI